MAPASKIFIPHRALGMVSNDIPLVTRYIQRRKENLIVTVVGNCFHTYGATKLRLLSVGNAHVDRICCITADSYHIYTACNNTIYAWRRGTELKHRYEGHEAQVHLMLPFGPHLISVDKANFLRMWDIKMESLFLEVEFPMKTFEISAICHPATYLNKILLGSNQGKLQLWNMKTSKVVYTFSGWDSPVAVLEQAPALDVVAIGLEDGQIILHNLKFDKTVVKFKQDWGRVTGVGFRTDDTPVMATGSLMGHVALWDLKEKRLLSQVRNAHSGPVTGLKCFPSEPLMVTSSPDNTLKIWIFDMPDGGARLLKFREGHSEPPLVARFHGSLGETIVSGGEDSTMRLFSPVTDKLMQSLGQASMNRKASKKKSTGYERLRMPAITGFTSETAQEKAWDNLVAIHRNRAIVTTWSISSQKMGEHKLAHDRFRGKECINGVATCIDLTVCGNFVVIGYDTGHVDKFNVQSGIYKGSYGKETAHEDAVRGVVADGMNQVVVSGGQDGDLKWWKLKSFAHVKTLKLESGIAKMALHRDSGLLGVALDDWRINVIDVDTKNIARALFGHSNQITDLGFSPNSKWLISCSMDKTIRTWDLPSGSCVDKFLTPIPATSLAVSPVGDFLITTHVSHLGIYLWANQACFTHVALRPLAEDEEVSVVDLPTTAADESHMPEKEGDESEGEVEEITEDDEEYKSPQQISEDLVTLALLPTSRWVNLLSLDVIKAKNKPVEPPKVPKAAPFFIPTVPGVEFKLATEQEEETNTKLSKPKFKATFEMLTPLGRDLKETKTTDEYERVFQRFMALGPAAIEAEIRSLDPDTCGTEEVMIQFLYMIKYVFDKNIYFEAAQGYFGLFMKLHAEYILNNDSIHQVCTELQKCQKESWHEVRDGLDQALCLISYFKNAALLDY
ncbi:WD repeat-containing protein 36 [Oratosquilla oratoria]|uniref:WD repeat-containing protein 36 n=1 Tax=Oratosquilla oratoria TaxID=337810 RepID=UPI003F76DDB7